MVMSETPKSKEALSGSLAWVDVRDTALGHVLALEKPEAAGQRIITAAGRLWFFFQPMRMIIG